ncbi:MAG: hypothetical protein JSS66_08370 [Armatimonadetes bacterium]|nr:hypothetical protein [Armatimonadota bacterium]
MKSFDDISNEVSNNGDVMTITMGALRDAAGAGKLGEYVRKNISENLSKRGIGHLPEVLPVYQEEFVRLFRQGSAAGKLIHAVTTPGAKQDAVIREATEQKPSEVLDKIKALVCD